MAGPNSVKTSLLQRANTPAPSASPAGSQKKVGASARLGTMVVEPQAHIFQPGLNPPEQIDRPLSSRRGAMEMQFRAMTPTSIFQRGQTLNVESQAIRQGARDIFAGKPVRGGRKTELLSLQLAAACLEEGASEGDIAALLTPLRGKQHRQQDVAEYLRESAGDQDKERFEQFLDDVLAALDDRDGEKLRRDLQRERNTEGTDRRGDVRRKLHEARNKDDAEVMQVLREVQGIATLQGAGNEAARADLRQAVQDRIRNFQDNIEDSTILLHFNAADVAVETPDATTFLATYTAIVMDPAMQDHPAKCLKAVKQRYSIDAVQSAIRDINRALGEEMKAATPAREMRWIETVVKTLGNMRFAASLIDAVRELVDLLRRTGHVHA